MPPSPRMGGLEPSHSNQTSVISINDNSRKLKLTNLRSFMTRPQISYLALDCDTPHNTAPFLSPPPLRISCSSPHPTMGICHSAHDVGFSDSEPLSPRAVERKRSIALSHLASTAVSAHSQETIVTHSEKGPSVHRKEHYVSLPPPLYDERLVTADLVRGGSTNAYKSFLRQYPEYKLTWLLDSLRKSDFKRLEKSGEVYVDYMGGSLYPESLVRMHSAFLQENILGNTHSVSNR